MFWKIQLYHSMHWESVTHRPLIKEWSINQSMNILSKNMSTVILQPCSFGFLLATRISINNWRSLLSILQEQKENNEVEFTQGLLRHISNHIITGSISYLIRLENCQKFYMTRFFRQTILRTKNAKIATIFAKDKTTQVSIWIILVLFLLQLKWECKFSIVSKKICL